MDDTSVKGAREKRFQILINVILILLTLAALLPFLLLLGSSFTEDLTLQHYGYNFWPRKFSAYAYEFLFSKSSTKIFRAYGITFFVTIVGTVLSLLVGPLLAYPLSRKDYKRAGLFTFLVVFTMLFNGGIVPSYIMWTQTFHLKNTILALILPNLLFNGFFIMLYKNNFATNIHPALIEAAKIDGAGEWYIYFKIIMPLSLPILATIGLMVGLSYWNDWTNGLYYIDETNLYSLQQFLQNIINSMKSLQDLGGVSGEAIAMLPTVSIRMAIAIIGVLPVMVLYPFFQKAFVAGISLGGVKE